MIILQILLIITVPYFIIKYKDNVLTDLIGTIGLAYLLGLIVSVVIFVINKSSISISLNKDVSEIVSFLTISIAIPLLLFSTNLSEVKKLSRSVRKSFLSLVASASIVSIIVFFIYGKTMNHGGELSGMAIGLYTGGTPNLNAIGNILSVPNDIIAAANLSDILFGGIFYVFLLLACKPLLKKILPSDVDIYLTEETEISNIDDVDITSFQLNKQLIRIVIIAFLMALISAVIGVVIWLIIPGDSKMFDILVPVLMIGVTVFGILGSFQKSIRETKGGTVVGQYFILVFSFSLASSINFGDFDNILGGIFLLYTVITLGVFILHVLISKILKIDADLTMVTLTAGVYGPAFVPAITKQIKNNSLTAPGLIVGSLGYVIGTFLGGLIGYLLILI